MKSLLNCLVIFASSFKAQSFLLARSNGLSTATPKTRQKFSKIFKTVLSMKEDLEGLKFLSPKTAFDVRNKHGTPSYVYDKSTLEENARACLSFPNAFGLTVRFAMKSSPNRAILQLFDRMGLHIDASSGWEVKRAMDAGIPPSKISLSSQELPENFAELLEMGVSINACSLSQLEKIGAAKPGSEVGLRINPGLGSGGTQRTNVGGPGSSFGIWHELMNEILDIVGKNDLKVVRIHTHIGSGSDPAVWQKVSHMSINLVRPFPLVTSLNLGGGYKVGRMKNEASTDLLKIGEPVKKDFEAFYEETGRKLKLEIEPGTFLVANACSLLTSVQDIVRTLGSEGRTFVKLDAGMTELLRPSLYGAQHPIIILPNDESVSRGPPLKYVVVGHCCESGDILTPSPGEPDVIGERYLDEARIGDICVIEGCGAYVSGMSAKNYNSFPEAPEILLDNEDMHVIRKRQSVEQIYQNEFPLPNGC
mmetsp:Transcript_3327/g.5173  ORF Transcript_3327/g.5173 Transcript_3327/m.5173 type:complete len:477 (+) Transcript_3327:3-1433(+)